MSSSHSHSFIDPTLFLFYLLFTCTMHIKAGIIWITEKHLIQRKIKFSNPLKPRLPFKVLLLRIPSPSRLQPYKTSDLRDFRPSRLQPYETSDLRDFRPTRLQTFETSDLRDFRPSRLQPYETSDLRNFNPRRQTYETSDFKLFKSSINSLYCFLLI